MKIGVTQSAIANSPSPIKRDYSPSARGSINQNNSYNNVYGKSP